MGFNLSETISEQKEQYLFIPVTCIDFIHTWPCLLQHCAQGGKLDFWANVTLQCYRLQVV